MYQYQTETQYAIRGMVEAAQPFDIDDIKVLTETILEDDGKYHDPVIAKDLKMFMLALFEKGHIPGYLLMPKYVCDETGPKVTLEFIPENALTSLDLINKPDKDGRSVKCVLHGQYKELLEMICAKANCTQDMMIRSILVRALDAINDQLK
jgi:hypothetical protein